MLGQITAYAALGVIVLAPVAAAFRGGGERRQLGPVAGPASQAVVQAAHSQPENLDSSEVTQTCVLLHLFKMGIFYDIFHG